MEPFMRRGDIDVNLPFHTGCTPLGDAAEGGFVSVVDRLLLGGADVNLVDSNQLTALSRAASDGRDAVIERLLQEKTLNVYLTGKDGTTALDHAARQGHHQIVQLLLPRYDRGFGGTDDSISMTMRISKNVGYTGIVNLLQAHEETLKNRPHSSSNPGPSQSSNKPEQGA